MISTQDHLRIKDIQNNLISLTDRSVSMVLKTSAVNFGLLSEEEQVAIIYSFAGMLNSLSFPIQIVVRSSKLDVSSYINNLDLALKKQRNPLLARMMARYKDFVKSVIKENEVLDKQFYICINVTGVEIGILTSKLGDRLRKAQTVLTPRRDHLIRQLSRVGIRARQVETEELIKLFYAIYNGEEPEYQVSVRQLADQININRLREPSQPALTNVVVGVPQPSQPVAPQQHGPFPPAPALISQLEAGSPLVIQRSFAANRPPFYVEELTD